MPRHVIGHMPTSLQKFQKIHKVQNTRFYKSQNLNKSNKIVFFNIDARFAFI